MITKNYNKRRISWNQVDKPVYVYLEKVKQVPNVLPESVYV